MSSRNTWILELTMCLEKAPGQAMGSTDQFPWLLTAMIALFNVRKIHIRQEPTLPDEFGSGEEDSWRTPP